LGATAIEDKLQVGVERTIENIRKAGIKLWVLTGDKLETARNIGFSCRVLSVDMDILVLDDGKQDELLRYVKQAARNEENGVTTAMLVTGAALAKVMADDTMQKSLLDLAETCSVVIACRVSPAQKAEMVRLVADNVKLDHRTKPITLAIGDGANDVPMIQEAKIGVGIYGKEGMQAVNSSDVAIGQFQFLERLLLIHGRWNYIRSAKVVLFTFWRNAALVLAMFYYTLSTGYTAVPLFEDMVRGTFNVVTFIPTICTGIFDRDYEAELVLRTPELYGIGRLNQSLNTKEVIETMVSAFVHSLILLGVMRFAYEGLNMTSVGDVWTFGTCVFTCLMLQVVYRCVLITDAWNIYFWLGITFGCIFPYVVFLWVYCSFGEWNFLNMMPMYHVSYHLAFNRLFWFCLFTVPALAATLDLFKRYLWQTRLVLGADDLEAKTAVKRAATESKAKAVALAAQESLAYELVPTRQNEAKHPVLRSSSDFNHPEHPRHPATLKSKSIASTSRSGSSRQSFTTAEAEDDSWDSDADSGVTGDFNQQTVRICWNCMSASTFDYEECVDPDMCPCICAATCTSLMSIMLLVFSLFVLLDARGVNQVRIRYDGMNVTSAWYDSFNTNKDDVHHHCPVNESCRFSVTVEKEMKPPILVYYKLWPYHQNFADYFKSAYWPELLGRADKDSKKYMKACHPEVIRETPQGKRIVPCGIQAKAFFNDTFEFLNVGMTQEGIAWKSDMSRFKDPNFPDPSNISWLYQRFPTIIQEATGVKNGHFAVWMRPDAYKEVRKKYGYINTYLQPNFSLDIQINASYPIANVGSGIVKELVITTLSSFGGRDESFGWFLLFFSVVCFLVSACICCVEGWLKCIDTDGEDDDEEKSVSSSAELLSEAAY
jgi:phosphoserine phosphatase